MKCVPCEEGEASGLKVFSPSELKKASSLLSDWTLDLNVHESHMFLNPLQVMETHIYDRQSLPPSNAFIYYERDSLTQRIYSLFHLANIGSA